MQFRLSGSVEIRHDGATVPIPRGHQRTLLAALLLHPGSAIAVDELCTLIWDADPPADPGAALHLLVLRLRRRLPAGAQARIVTRSPGYLIDLGEDTVDLLDFVRHADETRAAASGHDWRRAAASAQAALQLWRGEPLAGVASAKLRERHQHRLDGVRLDLLELHAQAELHLGRHAQLIDHLQQLVREHPLRETFSAHLMTAYYRAGRQVEALAVYRETRATLVAELGVEPGPQLQDLHRRILAGDPDLTADPPPPHAPRDVPRQLPATISHFVGRTEQISALTTLADQADRGGAVVISAIGGLGGIGKTALATHWAHQVAHRYPDGQLYVNLRGFHPAGPPMAPTEALQRFLSALGVAAGDIPVGLDEQAASYRSLLADRRVLVILDNARDADQVRPLLPGSSGCLVLVTSRNRLASLVAVEGAAPLTLDLFTPDEAQRLLAHRIGTQRVAGEPEAADQLIELCARLPLALNIAAARAVVDPGLPLAALTADLRETHHRLDRLSAGDARADVRTVFSSSYQQLTEPAARMFRLLALHPGPDISLPAAAGLAGVTPEQARALLADLIQAHLLERNTAARFTLHDLLRAYAIEQTRDHEDDRHPALLRMWDHYLHTAHAGALRLSPNRAPLTLVEPTPGARPEEPADYDRTLAWFEAEEPVLLAIIRQAADEGADRYAWQLSWCIAESLDRRGHFGELAAVQRVALAAAQRLADPDAEARVRGSLGRACIRLGAYEDAGDHLRQTLAIFERLGDATGRADTHVALAGLAGQLGVIPEVLHNGKQALHLYRLIGHRMGQAIALNVVGWSQSQLGDHQQAVETCRQSVNLAREMGVRAAEGTAWDSLGLAHHQLGQYADAIACYQEAIAVRRELGHRSYEAATLSRLGDTHLTLTDYDAAREAWQHALTLLAEADGHDAQQLRARLDKLPD